MTDTAQFVDDNVGKTIKQMANKEFNLELEKFDFVANPKGTITASEKRKMTARIYNKVIGDFNADPHKQSLLKNPATRTGMTLTIYGRNLDKFVPVKYFLATLKLIQFLIVMVGCRLTLGTR